MTATRLWKKPLVKVAWFAAIVGLTTGCEAIGRQKPNPSIIFAASAGDLSRLEHELDTGADVNDTDSDGRTALYVATLNGQLAAARLLVDRGADFNKGASWKADQTPLHVAASNGYVEIIRLLLAHGDDVNKRDDERTTPLIDAARNLQVEAVQCLLDHGADAKSRNRSGQTALLIERHSEHPDDYAGIVKMLIAHGADVNNRDRWDHTPLSCAIWYGDNNSVLALLEAGADVHAMDSEKDNSFLDAAMRRQQPEKINTLIKAGAKSARQD